MNDSFIKVTNLSVNFPVSSGITFWNKESVKAVSGVSIEIKKGECLAVVGESGCGKTTLANALIGLVTPTEGEIYFKGEEIYTVSNTRYKEIRKNMQIIFQNPFSSLNPRFTVKEIISEPYLIRGEISDEEVENHVVRLLELVGLSKRDLNRHIFNFSGGQRQRIAIARAVALNPEFLICDEPVSALDVSVHSQILNLLMELQKELNLTYLFISHNLAVVRNIATKVAVMYLGEIVEYGEVDEIFNNPIHPYTRALLSAVKEDDDVIILEGEIPSPINPPKGCKFCTRCSLVEELCHTENPPLKDYGKGHTAACHVTEREL